MRGRRKRCKNKPLIFNDLRKTRIYSISIGILGSISRNLVGKEGFNAAPAQSGVGDPGETCRRWAAGGGCVFRFGRNRREGTGGHASRGWLDHN
jgi:hypothetical protein